MGKIIKLITLTILLLFFLTIANAELITSEYQTIRIDDDLNYKYITDYNYTVYINGSYYGQFTKGEEIFYPNNSEITIFIPAPIKTDFGDLSKLITSSIVIMVGVLITFGIILIIWFKLIKKAW